MKENPGDGHGAVEKCRAVLGVWLERQPAGTICQELGIGASLLCQWQDRAIWGMLEALEPRRGREGQSGPALPAQVKRLLDRRARARELQHVGRTRLTRPVPPPATN